MADRFVSEPLEPDLATADTGRMAAGGPGLPRRFRWGKKTVEIAGVLRTWRETGPCRHGSGEMYVRKHWYEVKTTDGAVMKIYFHRQPRGGRKNMGWFLLSVRE